MSLSALHPFVEQSSPSLGWWLQVDTNHPIGIRYFGPFGDQKAAESSKEPCCAELIRDNIQVLDCQVKFCQPRQLVIDEQHLHMQDLQAASLQLFMSLVQNR